MILIELDAYVDSLPGVKTFYVSDARFVTSATDTPANTAFDPSVVDPGTIGVQVFSDGQTTGATELETGEIVLSNANGQYDAWLDHSFEGRAVTIRRGDGGAYPAAFPVIFSGTVANVTSDKKSLLIRLKDKQHIFDTEILTTRYAGTNSGATGIEGLANDIKGTVKPRTYGKVFKIKPVPVNTNKQVYQVSDGAILDVDAVYERGASWTKGADYADLTTLNAASLAAGSYGTCKALGLFRLASAPQGLITADVTQGATAADRTVAQILKALALAAGVAGGDIDAASVTALDTANSAPVGIYIDDERTYLEAMDEVARSVGAYYGFNPSGKFVMGVWSAPSGTSLATIGEYYVGKNYERRSARDNPTPVYAVVVKHTKYGVVQTDVAGSVSADIRAALQLEYRAEASTDAAVKTKYKLALTLEVETLLTAAADASTEAARLLTLHKVRRDSLEFPIPLDLVADAGLKLGACVTLQISRFGLSGGKLMRIQRIRLELAKGRAILTVWG